MSVSDVLVSLQGVSKSYDERAQAVRGLDLDIHAGEFLTLLGPSGSGKTSTLMMLAGFELPTTGKILFKGAELDRLPPHKRNFGVVFQDYALFPHLTVERNLAYPLRFRKVSSSETRRRVGEALTMLQLSAYRHRLPRQLSGGQQQRVALGRALIFDPHLVLMDEPLGALDRQLRERMQIEIKHLHQRLRITIVSVTHDQGEALTMSDRIAVFNEGALQQIGSPAAIYERPANAFVARFIGDSNFLRGQVIGLEGERCAIRCNGSVISATRVDCGPTGSEAILSIRPERVHFTNASASTVGEQNVLEGIVLEHIYFGDALKLRFRIAGSDDFLVKIPVGQISSIPQKGDSIALSWAQAHCHAFAATAETVVE